MKFTLKSTIFSFCLLLIISCKPGLDKYGGISITLTNQGENLSTEQLKQDFITLQNRLDGVVKGSFDIKYLQNENTIKVSIPKETDLEFFQWFLTTKGHFQLKETFDAQEVWSNFDDIRYLLNDSNRLGIASRDHNSGENVKRHLFSVLHRGITIPFKGTPEMGFAGSNHLNDILKVLRHRDMVDVFPPGLEPMWTAFLNSDSVYSLIATAKVRNIVRIENNAIEKCKVEESRFDRFDVKILLKPEFKTTLVELTKDNLDWWIAVTIDDRVLSFPSVYNVLENGTLTIGGFGSEIKPLALASILNNPMLNADWDVAQSQMMGPQP